MKKVYWHPHNLPRIIIVVFCIFVLCGLFVVEHYKQVKYGDHYKAKLEAALTASKAFNAVKKGRLNRGIAISSSTDPQQSGLIGRQLTSISSDSSQVFVKRSTINPNIAALFVQWLKDLKLKKGDNVAITMTGSFPALDISMLSAIRALKLNPLITFSAAASQYGANIPNYSWLIMYHVLQQAKIFDFPVLGASLGGRQDRGYGMDPRGVKILEETITKYNYPFIASGGTIDGINKRMAIYQEASAGKHIRAYINVGGNMTSIGLKRIKTKISSLRKPKSLASGVVESLPIGLANVDSVAVRFLREGVPVINVHNVYKMLVEKYGFPARPQRHEVIGFGPLFYSKIYNTWLALGVLVLDILVFIIIAIISRKYMIRYKP